MQPLDLQTWGGGLELNYSLAYVTNPNNPTGPKQQLYEVAAGNSNGNPALDPWRSTNYGASLEYYINPVSMVSLELFRIDVKSFIENGNVKNCSLPDEDGVVRHRCITIVEPVQGIGNSIQGAEVDYRQGFTFLPGLLRYTGMEVNATYAPSKTGQTDLAGNAIPFQDNSTESGNFILWFQSKRFQVRAAYNYRSKRAVENQVGSIAGRKSTRRRRSISTRPSNTRSANTRRCTWTAPISPTSTSGSIWYGPVRKDTRTSPNAVIRSACAGSGERGRN